MKLCGGQKKTYIHTNIPYNMKEMKIDCESLKDLLNELKQTNLTAEQWKKEYTKEHDN